MTRRATMTVEEFRLATAKAKKSPSGSLAASRERSRRHAEANGGRNAGAAVAAQLFTVHEPLRRCIRLPMPPTVNSYQPHALIAGKIVRHFSAEGLAFKDAIKAAWLSH